ncbi:hypothetical protein [Streptococcus ovuberis]|uniref:Uncharacterized protein n=1 Tax=Streptococcus ovuberis TaxID=1936207 RepID=A0A7X6N238_9STRE|nr:hypothetical protein [Streptococcus ovuberis]NKZ20812.1 hypothetical protein [Streptococcus ovuberis]
MKSTENTVEIQEKNTFEQKFDGIRVTEPEMITIPKSEYDLLIAIKNKFLEVKTDEQTDLSS